VSGEIVFIEELPHPPEKVWSAVTDSRDLADWLMPNDFEPRIGHSFRLECPSGPGVRGWVECTVLELEPPRRMVWSWSNRDGDPPSRVEFRLEAMAGGTRLTLTHSNERDALQLKRFEGGWKEKLAGLRQRLAR
jgi:uncharacterized protein YndB with AHSA1/START domain